MATQNGQSIDSQGGIDATVNLTALMTFTDNYGKTVTTPLIDMAFQQYIKGITGNCNWVDVPTFGFRYKFLSHNCLFFIQYYLTFSFQ